MIIACLVLFLVAYVFIFRDSGYYPLVERTRKLGVSYQCKIKRERDVYTSIISRYPNLVNRKLSLPGKVVCMALSKDDALLAIGIAPMAGPNESGYYWLSATKEIVFLDTITFRILFRWPTKPINTVSIVTKDYTVLMQPIVRFDRMAFSADGKRIATYFWKTSKEGRKGVVTLWEVKTGKLICEYSMPDPDRWLKAVHHGESCCGLAFSSDDSLIAASGCWPVKDPNVAQPDGFLLVWGISKGSLTVIRIKDTSCVWDLCFDKSGKRIACWTWAGRDVSLAKLLVFDIPTGNLVLLKTAKGRPWSITWSKANDSFVAKMESGTEVFFQNS